MQRPIFQDRPKATATTLRGEFLFKSLLKLPEVDSPPQKPQLYSSLEYSSLACQFGGKMVS